MSEQGIDDLERRIRGVYVNVPAHQPGLCEVCSAPTSSPKYLRCVPCDGQMSRGIQLSRGVVMLSWAPMVQVEGYSGQGYSDLLHYKESDATTDQRARLRTLLWLAFTKHSDCIIPNRETRTFAIAYVPSTSGLREGPHPIETNFMSMFAGSVHRVVPTYVGEVGGDRNARRRLSPESWRIDRAAFGDIDRVLIIDDTWVSGGHVQSVAAAFELSGIAARTVVLGRALDPSRTDHGSFLRGHAATPFDSDICPVHRTRHI